jgi:hypothetical protein
MDKKYIYLGLGLVALGGLAYYFMSGRTSGAKSMGGGGSSASDEPLTDGTNSSTTTETAASSLDSTLGTRVSAGTGKKEIRRNCRQEARDRGLRGRNKRQFRRNCRRSGGFDDGLDM